MDNLSPEMVILGILGCLVIGFLVFVLGKEKYPYYARKTLLTPTELKFYKNLLFVCNKSFPELGIAMQVRLADIINCSESDWQKGYGPKISAKHIDFVLFDKKTTIIMACIELDDPSHDRSERKRRDVFVNKALDSAGVPLLRILTKDMNKENYILSKIKDIM